MSETEKLWVPPIIQTKELRSPFVTPRPGIDIKFESELGQTVLHSIQEIPSEDETGVITGIVSYDEIAGAEEEFELIKGTRLIAAKEFILKNKLGLSLGLGAVTVSAATGFLIRRFHHRH